jgi:hypothetical protein
VRGVDRVVQLPARGGSGKINLPGLFGKKKSQTKFDQITLWVDPKSNYFYQAPVNLPEGI